MPDATTASPDALSVVVAEQRQRLADAWRGALRGEAEALRRVRIATRRLREIAGLARQLDAGLTGKRMTRDLRRIARALGLSRELAVARRDLDRAATAHAWSADLAGLVDRWLDRRSKRAAREMRAKLRRVDIDALDGKLAALAIDLDEDARASKPRNRLAAALARRARQVGQLRAHCLSLYEPERLHALRIAIRKLRYVAELSEALSASDMTPLLARLRREQRRLGRLHDLQVLLRETQACAATSPVAAGRLAPVIEALERDCRRDHGGVMAALPHVDAAVAGALRAAAELSRPDHGRLVRARLDATEARATPSRVASVRHRHSA